MYELETFGALCFAEFFKQKITVGKKEYESKVILKRILFDFYNSKKERDYIAANPNMSNPIEITNFVANPVDEWFLNLMEGCMAKTIIEKAKVEKRIEHKELESIEKFRFRAFVEHEPILTHTTHQFIRRQCVD